MALNTYLFFDGNCREAFEFYKAAFGGDFAMVMTYAEAPEDMSVPDDEKDRIMHISLPVGTSMLMGSDSCSWMSGPPNAGDNFAVSIDVQSREQCDDLFAKLSEGGTVKLPMADTFWGAYFGNWTDKFGISWMVSYELPRD